MVASPPWKKERTKFMFKLQKTLLISLIYLFVFASSMTSYTSGSNTTRAAGTRAFSQTLEKTVSGSQGNIVLSYTISGNYTYDLNSGAILSAYNEKLKEYSIVSGPGGEDPEGNGWVIWVEDLVIGPPTVSGTGDNAKFPIRFHAILRKLPGGLDMGTWDYGIVNDYAIIYAE